MGLERLGAKNVFQEKPRIKYLREALVVQFLFSRSLLLVLAKFSFWEGDSALGYDFLRF